MANSGLKRVVTLRKYINGIATDEVKENVKGTEGYIPDIYSEKACPIGCDAVVSGTNIVQGTTTTSSTTTTTTRAPYVDAVDYTIENYDQINTVTIAYTDTEGVLQTVTVLPDSSVPITSITLPKRVSGTTYFVVQADGAPYEVTTTTTTKAPVTAVDYVIDTTQESQSVIVEVTQIGQSTVSETEINAGEVVSIASETIPRVISDNESTVISDTGTGSYDIDTTNVNSDTTVEYTPTSSPTEVTIQPKGTVTVDSSTTPTVVAGDPATTVTNTSGTIYEVDSNAATSSSTVEFTPSTTPTEIVIAPKTEVEVETTVTPEVTSPGTSTSVNSAGDNYYEVDTTSSASDTTVEYTPGGSSSTTTQDFSPGNRHTLPSDTTPTVVAGDPSTTITVIGTEYTPEEDTYTVTNNDYYNVTEVEFREYGGVSETTEVSPRETVTLTSQDTPTVVSGQTDVSVVAAGQPSQPDLPSRLIERNCDQYDVTNEGATNSVVSYADCDRNRQEATVSPGETVTVPSTQTPIVVSGSTDVTIINTKANGNDITPNVTTTTTTTAAPTTSTTTRSVQVADVVCDSFEYDNFVPSGDELKTNALWKPLSITAELGKSSGNFIFTETYGGAFPVLYRIYDGGTLIFDKCFFESSFFEWRNMAREAFLSNGFTNSEAISYSTKQNDIPSSTPVTSKVVEPLTSHTITKVTNSRFVNIEIYSPVTNDILQEKFRNSSGAYYASKFIITCP